MPTTWEFESQRLDGLWLRSHSSFKAGVGQAHFERWPTNKMFEKSWWAGAVKQSRVRRVIETHRNIAGMGS